MAEQGSSDKSQKESPKSAQASARSISYDAANEIVDLIAQMKAQPSPMETSYQHFFRLFREALSSTDTTINTSIITLDALEKKLAQLQREELAPLRSDLDAVKTQIQASKETLSTLNEFISDNSVFLTNLVSAQGKIVSMESQLTSILARIEKLESDKALKWNQIATIVSILIAFTSMCITLVSVAAAIYFALAP